MIVVAAIQISGGRGKKAPPSLARRHRLGRWTWRNSRWQGRRWSFYIPFSEKTSAIGAAKHSALAYATNHHERGGQEQSGSRDLHPSPHVFERTYPHYELVLRCSASHDPVSKKSPASSCTLAQQHRHLPTSRLVNRLLSFAGEKLQLLTAPRYPVHHAVTSTLTSCANRRTRGRGRQQG